MNRQYSHHPLRPQRFGVRLRPGAMLAGMAGCTPDDNAAPTGADEPLCIRASINEPTTRASGTQWDKDDAIGITFTFDGTENPELRNRKFVTAEGDGLFVRDDNGIPVKFEPTTQRVGVSAYYPFTGSTGTFPAEIQRTLTADDQKDAASRAAIDYLYASADTNSSTLNLRFRHCMARLIINCEQRPGLKEMKDVTCCFTRVGKGTFNTQSGVALATGTDTDSLLVVIPADVMRGEYILFPQPDNDPTTGLPSEFLFSVKMEGKDFQGFAKDDAHRNLLTLRAGSTYTLNLLLDDAGVTISSAGSITPGDWPEGGTTDTSSTPSNP